MVNLRFASDIHAASRFVQKEYLCVFVQQSSNFHNKVGGLWDVAELGTIEQMGTKMINNISIELFGTNKIY